MDLSRWSSNVWNQEAATAITQGSSKTIELKSVDGTIVTVNKALLLFFSKYYKAALSGKFSDAKKNTFDVELSGADLEHFKNWLDTGDIKPPMGQNKSFSTSSITMAFYNMIAHIHTSLPESSPLREHVLAHYIAHWTPQADEGDDCMKAIENDSEGVFAGFLYELLVGVAGREEVDPKRCACCRRPCEYHEHESAEEWSSTCGSIQSGRFRLPKEFVDGSSNEDELVEELE